MPIYGFRCSSAECGHTEEHYYPVRESVAAVACEKCFQHSERDLTVEARNHIPGGTYPFITKNLNGQPIEVRDPGHLKELCRMYGKTLRDDAAYEEDEYKGVDFRTGQQRYKDGRGQGTSRSWF